MSSPEERVARAIVLLRAENQVGVTEIREMGRIAKSCGITRGKTEPYDQFLARILERITRD